MFTVDIKQQHNNKSAFFVSVPLESQQNVAIKCNSSTKSVWPLQCEEKRAFSSPGQSPGRAIILPSA